MNPVRMVVSMKKLLFIFIVILVPFVSSFAQVYESPRIAPNWLLEFNKEKIFTVSNMQDANLRRATYLFDGKEWKDLNIDTMPTFHIYDSKAVISEFSNSIFMTGHYHLWEYDGKGWNKHAIYDSLYHRRRYEQMIELPDSSLLITAKTFFITLSSGNIVLFNAIRHELLKFKNGRFTILSSFLTSDAQDPNLFQTYGLLRNQKNGRYSFITNEYSDNKLIKEFILFETDGTIVNKYRAPNLDQVESPKLDEKYRNANIAFNDYLFDSKGSIWFLTQSELGVWVDSTGKFKDTLNFAGLIEINSSGEVNYFNENLGIHPSEYKSTSFDIDDSENIWFMFNHRRDNTKLTILPTLYKLDSNRTNVIEYTFENILANSRIYNGGKLNEEFELTSEHKTLKYNSYRGSIFITSGNPMLEFFPKGIPPTSVMEVSLIPERVYPNPVPQGRNLTVESEVFLGNSNQVQILVRDISGAVVKEYPYTLGSENGLFSVNTDGLIQGTYYISVQQNNKLILQTSFVKE